MRIRRGGGKEGVGGWIVQFDRGGGGKEGVGGKKKFLGAVVVEGVGWSKNHQNRSDGSGKKDIGQCLGGGVLRYILVK